MPRILWFLHIPVPGILELRNFSCRVVLGSFTHRTSAYSIIHGKVIKSCFITKVLVWRSSGLSGPLFNDQLNTFLCNESLKFQGWGAGKFLSCSGSCLFFQSAPAPAPRGVTNVQLPYVFIFSERFQLLFFFSSGSGSGSKEPKTLSLAPQPCISL